MRRIGRGYLRRGSDRRTEPLDPPRRQVIPKLVISREASQPEGTFSRGVLDDDLSWDFVELPWKGNAPEVSCVPAGVYHARLTHSQHFGRTVYLLEGVPNRAFIEIHPANWGGDKDAGFHSDLRGCCAPGTARGLLVTPGGKLQEAVLHSGLALDQLIEAAGESMSIEFKWTGDSPEGGDK